MPPKPNPRKTIRCMDGCKRDFEKFPGGYQACMTCCTDENTLYEEFDESWRIYRDICYNEGLIGIARGDTPGIQPVPPGPK